MQHSTKKQGIAKGAAVVGVSGVKRMLARFIKKDMYIAKDRNDALKWLANL